MEVERVKAHRTKTDKKEMSHFEKFVTEGNEHADELAIVGAMFDEGCLAEMRAKTVQREREREREREEEEEEEVFAALQYAASFHCLVEEWKDCEELKPEARRKVVKKREEMKHQTEWCAQANKHRCMWCGRSCRYLSMPGMCTVLKCLSKMLGK